MDHLRQEKSREADGAKRWGTTYYFGSASYQDPLLNKKSHRISAGSEAHKETREGENDFKRLRGDDEH